MTAKPDTKLSQILAYIVNAPARRRAQAEALLAPVRARARALGDAARGAARGMTAPTRRADDPPPAEPPAPAAIVSPTPTTDKPLMPIRYQVQAAGFVELTGQELLDHYRGLTGETGVRFYANHAAQIDAARRGIKMDAGDFPKLHGHDRTIAALERQFPARR